ncbi:class I SAM-dependent methyltransferase [Nocardia sp. NBC_00511]|uniref:class I SAM-dependent methyltransferase n=1 Tax=Nocardia sp. NBC_00511 TaxID=2903591 RepID=UPI0030E13657
MTTPAENEQSARWNGPSGHAWVDTQAMLTQVMQPFEPILVDAVKSRSAHDVLDVGCGFGATTLAVARTLGSEVRCTGVDIAEPMVTAAQANADREDLPVRFLCADAQTHDFEPATFDMIMSRFGVMFFPDPIAAFTNLRRATRTGGSLTAIVWRDTQDNPFMTAAERAAAPLLPDLPPRIPNAPGQFGFSDREFVTTVLEASGWTDIDISQLDVTSVMPEPELLGYLSRFGPLGQILPNVEEPLRSRVIETARAAFAPFVHGNEVRYNAACWMVTAHA